VPSAEALRRLRWNCRRGLLENDLVLERFLDRYAGTLDDEALVRLNELLRLGDNELWDLITGRLEPQPRYADIVARLRED